MPTYKARYHVVRELREMKRLTQEEAWEQAGVAQGTYQAMESKKAYHEGREFKEANLVAVATLLGASLPDIAHGIPEAKAASWLLKELDDLREGCRSADQRVHTPHILVGMLKLDGSVLARAIAAESDVSPSAILQGLERILEKIAADVGSFRDFEWKENRYFNRALQYASLRSRDAIDGVLCLAVIQIGLHPPGSNTVAWLRRKLGDESLANVIRFLQNHTPPEPATPTFPESTLG